MVATIGRLRCDWWWPWAATPCSSGGRCPLAEIQEKHVAVAVEALVPLADDHDLVITHGNGPQVGLLALESARDPDLPHPYPLRRAGAQTQGMIGYFLLQALENALPGQEVVEPDLPDPGCGRRPCLRPPDQVRRARSTTEEEAERLARRRGWQVRPDGASWRRVVASPEPLPLVEMATIRMLVANGAMVVCAGGGGSRSSAAADGRLQGVEAVIDKDLTAACSPIGIDADALLLLTDVPHVEAGFGTADARPIRATTPDGLRALTLPAGSMGPKVDAACRFVEATGRTAVIGSLAEAGRLLTGDAGTVVTPD